MSEQDTIAALASAAGRAGVAVIRVSGADVPALTSVLTGWLPEPRRAVRAAFLDASGAAIDHGLVLYFPEPASFTGEHVVELHVHGSPALIDSLLARLTALGARLAKAGEFSQRAFLNDKLSLDQAEAIADIIDAGSSAAAAAAVRSLEGEFSTQIRALVEALVALRVYTEAAIDFPDEDDVDFLRDGAIASRLQALRASLQALTDSAREGAALRDGLRILILGRPNVGKSSLLNRLAHRDTAIVTDVAGTTRDVLAERLTLDGLPLTLIDTAGLRETQNPIEAEGVRRAKAELVRADRVLLVVDDRDDIGEPERVLLADIGSRCALTIIANKVDLSGQPGGLDRVNPDGKQFERVRLSASTGEGFDALAAHLKRCAGLASDREPVFIARRRHLQALAQGARALEAGHARLIEDAAGDLLAEELKIAQNALGEITGAVSSDDLLGEIFSSFCIGK